MKTELAYRADTAPDEDFQDEAADMLVSYQQHTAAFAALGPWLEYMDRLIQGMLLWQQQRPDDRFNMEAMLLPEDSAETAVHGMPHWSRQAGMSPWLDRVLPPPVGGRLADVVARFGLTLFETQVLMLAALPLFESRYGAIFAWLQDDDHAGLPSINLALALLSATPVQHLANRLVLDTQNSPLLHHHLVRTVARDGQTVTRTGMRYLHVNEQVFHFLCGEPADTLYTGADDALRWLTPAPEVALDIGAWATGAGDLARLCVAALPDDLAVDLVLLQGGHGRESLVVQLAAGVGRPVLRLDMAALPAEGARARVFAALQAVRLYDGVLLLRGCAEGGAAHPEVMRALAARLAERGQPAVCLVSAAEGRELFPGVSQLTVTLPPRTPEDDRRLLQACLQTEAGAADWNWGGLLTRTRVNPDALRQTLQEARGYQTWREAQAPLTEQDLRQALAARGQQHFGTLAQRVSPRRTFEDLIVNDGLATHLQEILAAIRQRDTLLENGFAHKVGYGTGVSALFYGESGTGKSMAAEVLAGALGVDLIRVDLSTVVNKYIGETEKNLAKIFDMAIADTGVLLFDEADALFGKRSEVKDAQDRHANIEVSYLLQRLEQYPGLVVLTSNNRAHLDEAFTRRLTFIAHFEAPDAALRERMWQTIWPAQVSVDAQVDWGQWAQVQDLTGAGIRNVALMAGWLAADAGRAVTHEDIARAVRRELDKTGRIMPALLHR